MWINASAHGKCIWLRGCNKHALVTFLSNYGRGSHNGTCSISSARYPRFKLRDFGFDAVTIYLNVRLLYEPGYVIFCIDNLTEENTSLSAFEFLIGV
jgi:hypothetical protein